MSGDGISTVIPRAVSADLEFALMWVRIAVSTAGRHVETVLDAIEDKDGGMTLRPEACDKVDVDAAHLALRTLKREVAALMELYYGKAVAHG